MNLSIKNVGLYFSVFSICILIAYVSAFYLVPNRMVDLLNFFEFRALLVGIILLLCLSVSLLVWWLYHVPPAKRALAVTLRTMIAFTIGAGFFGSIGWPQIKTIRLNAENGFLFETGENIPSDNLLWPIVLGGIVGCMFLCALYVYAEILEEKGLIKRA